MSIDDRDYMRNRNRDSNMESRCLRMSEQQKTSQAQTLKQRFAKYSGSPNRMAIPKAGWKRFSLILLVLVMGVMLLKRVPQISACFQSRQTKAPFPVTGAVRWFIPAPTNGVNDTAPQTITGLAEAGRHMAVRLDTWEGHAPVVMIPIRRKALSRWRFTARAINAWGIVLT